MATSKRCRDAYLASLDADDGLVVLLISADEIRLRSPRVGRGRRHAVSAAALGFR